MSQSNDKIYDLINSVRLELKQDIASQGAALGVQIGKLDNKLDSLEEKRIVPIEKDVSKLKIDSATGNVKLGALIFIGSAIVSTMVNQLLSKVGLR